MAGYHVCKACLVPYCDDCDPQNPAICIKCKNLLKLSQDKKKCTKSCTMIDENECNSGGCNPDRCYACPAGEFYSNLSGCNTTCSVGFYGDNSERTCIACKPGCATCTSLIDCSACFPPLTAENNNCTSSCSSG